jgi:hypothetical protein
MRPTIENVKQLEAAQNFRVGPTIERAKRQQEYIDSRQQQFGALQPYEESLREKTVGALMNLGMPRQRAQGFMGNLSADTILDSVGLIDFTPFALPFIFDEAKRGFAKAEKPTDYIAPTVEAGLGLIEAYPVTKVITKPIRTFLSNLANKTSVPTDASRRTFIQGAVAAPVVVGALSQIPLSKIAKDIKPVVEKVKFKLDLSSLESFQDKVEEFFDSAFLEGDMVRADIIDKTSDKDLFFGGLEQEIAGKEDFKGSFLEKMINEIKNKNPKVTDQQIFDELSNLFEGGVDYFSDVIPKTELNYKIKPIEKELQ